MPAHLQFENGGEAVALIPTRYPGSEAAGDGMIALARKTLWSEVGDDIHHGLGQRILATDVGDVPLMESNISLTGGGRRRTRIVHCEREPQELGPALRGPGVDGRSSRQLGAVDGRSSPPHERLQPALLDRLTDDEPDKKLNRARRACCREAACARRCFATWRGCSTPRGSSADTDLTRAPLRAAVGRQLRPAGALGQDRHLARRRPTSSARSGRRSSTSSRASCPARCRSGRCSRPSALDHHNVIGIEIRGQLWAQPVPLELLLRTEIDLETGKVEIADLAPTGWR